jgi:hypothetical protein
LIDDVLTALFAALVAALFAALLAEVDSAHTPVRYDAPDAGNAGRAHQRLLYDFDVLFDPDSRNFFVLPLGRANADNAVIRNGIERGGGFRNRKAIAPLNDLGEKSYRLGHLTQCGVVAAYVLGLSHGKFSFVKGVFGFQLLPCVGMKRIVVE